MDDAKVETIVEVDNAPEISVPPADHLEAVVRLVSDV